MEGGEEVSWRSDVSLFYMEKAAPGPRGSGRRAGDHLQGRQARLTRAPCRSPPLQPSFVLRKVGRPPVGRWVQCFHKASEWDRVRQSAAPLATGASSNPDMAMHATHAASKNNPSLLSIIDLREPSTRMHDCKYCTVYLCCTIMHVCRLVNPDDAWPWPHVSALASNVDRMGCEPCLPEHASTLPR